MNSSWKTRASPKDPPICSRLTSNAKEVLSDNMVNEVPKRVFRLFIARQTNGKTYNCATHTHITLNNLNEISSRNLSEKFDIVCTHWLAHTLGKCMQASVRYRLLKCVYRPIINCTYLSSTLSHWGTVTSVIVCPDSYSRYWLILCSLEECPIMMTMANQDDSTQFNYMYVPNWVTAVDRRLKLLDNRLCCIAPLSLMMRVTYTPHRPP